MGTRKIFWGVKAAGA